MTIKFIADYPPYKIGNTVTLTSAEEAALVGQKVAVTDLTGGLPYVAVVDQLINEPGKAWRYIGQESSLPKAAGTWRLFGYKNTRFVSVKTSRFVLPHTFLFGVGENMKAINNGYNNGNGLAHGSIIHNGVAHLAYAARLLGVDKNGIPVMQKLNDRDATANYGEICYLIVELPYEVEVGDTVVESGMSFQNAHNDTGGGTSGATQYMSYNNKTRGLDKFYRSSSSDPAVIQSWKDWADSPDVTTPPPGDALGDQQIGWKAQGLIAWVPAETVSAFSAGDSRNHGQDNGGTSNTDPGLDIYGANGESSRIWRNICNVGIQTEKAGDITDVSRYRRGELSVFCTVGDFDYIVNDLVAGTAITKENTCVAAYTALFQGFKQYVAKKFNVWVCRTPSPNVVSNNFLIDLAGQNPQAATAMRRISGAIRRGIPGNDGFIEGHNGVSASPDACVFKVPPQARKISTGTLTLSSVVATTDDAAYILGTASASIFNRDDNFLKGVIENAATGSATPPTHIKFLIEYISATTIKLWLRGSKDNPVPYPSTWINGSLPLAINMSTNPLYIGAEQECESAGTTYIHLSPEGEMNNAALNRQLGLPRI